MESLGAAGRSGRTGADLHSQLDLVLGRGIPPVSFWLAALYAIFSASHPFLLPKEAALMSLLAGSTAVFFAGLGMAARRRPLPPGWAHPVSFGIVLLVLLNSLIHLSLTRELWQTTNLMLIFVGSAFFLLSTRWFITAIVVGLAGWGLAVAQVPEAEGRVHFAFGLVSSLALSGVLHAVHLRTTRTFIQKQAEDDRRKLELATLNSIIKSIASTLDPVNVFQEIVDAVPLLIPHTKGASLQVLETPIRLVTRAWTEAARPQVLEIQIGEGAAGLAAGQGKIVNIADVGSDPRFPSGGERPACFSLLAVPLLAGSKVVGVISVEGAAPAAFGPEEERRVCLLSEYAAVAIENSRLYKEHALAEETLVNYTDHLQEILERRTTELRVAQEKIFSQKALEQEVELARQVQTSLLSQEIPRMDGFIFAATALPARYVGGDFYDFIQKGSECTLILADVSGKGMPAAMLTSTARALVRAAIKYESEPALILSNTQDAIYPDLSQAEMFSTFFAARLDSTTAAFAYANAGHTEAIWWRNRIRSVERFPATGLPIGIILNNEITQRQIHLCPGDMLVFYSDGITETLNPAEEIFGLERLIALVEANADDSAHTLAQRILTEVDSFANGAPLVDDLTLVVLKVVPRLVHFEYRGGLDQLDEIVGFIRRRVEMYGEDFAYQVELAVSEVVTNILEHAYAEAAGEVTGQLALDSDGVVLDFYDRGRAFDIAQLPPVDLELPHAGGYGLHIVRQLVDELGYTPGAGHRNHWRMAKKCAAGGG
jgi:serine phosphatase RsbU (regulator of sigma subunit)/anti-sigma regulatory factor (Ser/Thr protein kinase)